MSLVAYGSRVVAAERSKIMIWQVDGALHTVH
jgi:hypothetical protein